MLKVITLFNVLGMDAAEMHKIMLKITKQIIASQRNNNHALKNNYCFKI